MKSKMNFSQAAGLLVAALLFTLILTPVSVLAATGAGTVITNTATVTWAGGSASDSADVTVLFQETAPTVAFDSSVPATLTSVPETTGVTLTYTITSGANGDDNYTLNTAVSNAVPADLSAATSITINGVAATTTTVDLGASSALTDVTASADVVIPGLLANHGLDAGEIVVIGGTEYTISSVADDGTNTTLTLDAAVTISAGTEIYERLYFDVTFDTGSLLLAATSSDHLVDTDAEPTGNAALNSAAAQQTVTVTKAALTISKEVSTDGGTTFAASGSAQPGATLTYRIVVSNSGSADASSVVLTDPLSAFTTYNGGSALSNTAVTTYGDGTNTVLTDLDPADDGYDYNVTTGGTVTFDVGTLTTGSTIVLFFQADVN